MCGGFGKLSKLAAGHLDLHSRHSSIDLPLLAQWAAEAGASDTLQAAMRAANTSQEALKLAHADGVPLGDLVCAQALRVARDIVPRRSRSRCSRSTGRAASSGGAMSLRILLLGGTGDALKIARALGSARLQPGRPRQGARRSALRRACRRFGGARLAAYLRDAGIGLVIDATHPYAAQISANAAA
ncbi:precorrin-6A/cobalt-precorrin-6A reductase, partial [Burkholderia sp. HI4860]|nr:precorrin-6A/cobalt-precorrin-6A reductase [Burkholderia sp. HI4860]